MEAEGTMGARSAKSDKGGILDANATATDLMERILDRDNLNRAYQKVVSNKGAPGVDKMEVKDLLPYLKTHKDELTGSIRNGSYRPKPVRRVEIPKPDGGVRLLGVPTVVDRMVQQAVSQVLAPLWEDGLFSDHSYGFRPGRSAEMAVRKAKGYYDDGYNHVIDIDLAKFFDTVNHVRLIHMMKEVVNDERVIKLIGLFLNSGVLKDGLFSETDEGVPQGGPLSPLLSNIYLTKFDNQLEAKGLKFVRYADDCNIYVRSRRAAERVMGTSTRFLEDKLKLKVNQDKSQVGSPLRLKFLGFSFWKIGKKSGIRPHEKTLQRFKSKVKEITKRSRGRSLQTILSELSRYFKGWLGYYKIADLKSRLAQLDGWVRRRLRMYIWKQWKRVRTRFKNLKGLGVDKDQAWQWANTRKGYWRVAGSQILSTVLTNEWLKLNGYDSLLARYNTLRAKSS
jgi:group II intron reverse transcriptase/maturase